MSPKLTVAEKPAPKKRGPKAGTKYRKLVRHVCPECGTVFMGTAKRIYDEPYCQGVAARRRYAAAATAAPLS